MIDFKGSRDDYDTVGIRFKEVNLAYSQRVYMSLKHFIDN